VPKFLDYGTLMVVRKEQFSLHVLSSRSLLRYEVRPT